MFLRYLIGPIFCSSCIYNFNLIIKNISVMIRVIFIKENRLDVYTSF